MEGVKASMVLFEGALNDDEIDVADTENGYSFKRNGKCYEFRVTYWTFANEWCNHKHQFIAKTIENALKRYQRICGKIEDDVLDSISVSL